MRAAVLAAPPFASTLALGLVLGVAPATAHAADTTVHTTAELIAALAAANPGDVITLAPGTYAIGANLRCDRAGTAGAPITVRAATLGSAVISSTALEGFHVTAPHWRFERLEMRGACTDDSACEHAFHIVGAADDVTILGSRLVDFNAQIKGNGAPVGPGGAYVWPDDVVIAGNELFDTRPRNTSNPVTKIDVVGGRRWQVRANYIHDFAKAGGDTISYAAFLKGNSRDGVMERNLVVCERLHRGQVRLGLSLGGGGTSPDAICEDGVCNPEHQGGLLRNNVVAHCPADVGIYLNEAMATRVYHNTLYDTTGVDVRFATSTADLRGNLMTGAIRDRNGGTSTRADNVTGTGNTAFATMFRDPAALDFTLVDGAMIVDRAPALPDVPDDFCAGARSGTYDVGAIEYVAGRACDASMVHPDAPVVPGLDAGPDASEAPDAGHDAGIEGGPDGGGCCSTGGGAGPRALVAAAVLLAIGQRRRRRVRATVGAP